MTIWKTSGMILESFVTRVWKSFGELGILDCFWHRLRNVSFWKSSGKYREILQLFGRRFGQKSRFWMRFSTRFWKSLGELGIHFGIHFGRDLEI